MLLVTHHIADVIPEIDRVVMIQKGRIVADGPKDQLTHLRAAVRGLFAVRGCE